MRNERPFVGVVLSSLKARRPRRERGGCLGAAFLSARASESQLRGASCLRKTTLTQRQRGPKALRPPSSVRRSKARDGQAALLFHSAVETPPADNKGRTCSFPNLAER